MKRFLISIFLIGLLVVSGCAKEAVAQEDEGLVLKQTALYTWKDTEYKNSTVVTLAKTKSVEGWPTWANALVDGWILDAGIGYEDSTIRDGVVLAGREFGTLGKYLPIDFPLKDKINITLYVAGVYIDDVFNAPKTQGVSGVGYIQAKLKF